MRFTVFEVGDFRMFFYGRYRGLRHVVPTLAGADVVADEPPHTVVYRWYQLSSLGYTANLDIPTKKSRKGFMWDFSGVIQGILRFLS